MSEPFPWMKNDRPLPPRFGLTNGNLADIVPEPVKPRTVAEMIADAEREMQELPRARVLSNAEWEWRRKHGLFDDLGKG